uniref:Uncharacterized protein n=1 Tax=uncultured delta proteobacterium HF0130_19C20 TaxID=710828 RepID=E0XT78_9DELT|nr:hypothetical protein [uncultured delta proteobacterium HF0130_19C20]
MLTDRNRLSVCSDSLFKELAFSSCKPYNASSSLNYCQYFYFFQTSLIPLFFILYITLSLISGIILSIV